MLTCIPQRDSFQLGEWIHWLGNQLNRLAVSKEYCIRSAASLYPENKIILGTLFSNKS